MRHALNLVLVAAGLIAAAPAGAAQDWPARGSYVAQADAGDARKRPADERPPTRRSAKPRADDESGYGYGYERRQRGARRDDADDDRRRERNPRDERGNERRGRP